jgi:FKBP-type peptidyl-prolyl cis-trans isomerase SlyD
MSLQSQKKRHTEHITPDMIYDLDKDNFIKDGAFDAEHVYQDAILPLQDGNGQRFLARVLSIDDTKVKVDLNHPLAGKDLTFQGTILVNREASDDEIEALKEGQHQHHCCGGHCHHDGEGHCHHDGEGGCGGHCHHDGEGHCNEECEEGCGDGCCCDGLYNLCSSIFSLSYRLAGCYCAS